MGMHRLPGHVDNAQPQLPRLRHAQTTVLQKFRAELGDWFCTECNNQNKGFRKVCNWSACETRDWVCSCGNLSRSNRVVCNRRDPPCFERRPHNYD